ncbi:hypothetical protein [Shouchella tritolerans]|uniref:hypothetical protein n=1 Tax=Shouchella tritolerans TaxID=2979466 RepID=UPI0021E94109|nr:hypothetical protein [Shouchella tritolerans]
MEKGLRLERVTALDINRGVQPNYVAVVSPLERIVSTKKTTSDTSANSLLAYGHALRHTKAPKMGHVTKQGAERLSDWVFSLSCHFKTAHFYQRLNDQLSKHGLLTKTASTGRPFLNADEAAILADAFKQASPPTSMSLIAGGEGLAMDCYC